MHRLKNKIIKNSPLDRWSSASPFLTLSLVPGNEDQSQREKHVIYILWILSATTTGFSLRILAAASDL